MLPELPTFADFYRAVYGGAHGAERDPFPWQARLADHVVEQGWPAELGVPTGLGKTSAIDIAVWSLAAQADRAPAERTVPTRVWYLVDRRLLVDAASDHATRLAGLLEAAYRDPEVDPRLGAVAQRLAAISGVDRPRPLFVSRMRGGSFPGLRPPDPAVPSVICSTVAMYGSRLLFRGFASSNRMWPIDAALAGTDALVLLDEAHLALPLQQLLGVLSDCDTSRSGVLRLPATFDPAAGPASLVPKPRAYPQLVAMTATGHHKDRFDLDGDDLANPIVAQRLHATKPTALVPTSTKNLAATLADEATTRLAGLDEPGAAVVFVNRPATARAVADKLVGCDAEIVVLTGQLREPDADLVRQRLLSTETGCPSGASVERARPLVVVATQTLEVGADLDFDVCVSETAGVRAITQRWGRLNRLGTKPHASAALCHPDDMTSSRLYGEEPAAVWERLNHTDGDVDLSPANISTVLGDPTEPDERIPELLSTHLWEFAKTSFPPADAAPPEVFFAGIDDDQARVSVLWRAVIPAAGERLVPTASSREYIDLPIWEAREFLAGTTEATRLAVDGATIETFDPERMRSGDRIVLPSGAGGYTAAGWDPTSTEPVTDLSPYTRSALHLTEPAIANLLGTPIDDDLRDLLGALEPDPDDGLDPEHDQRIALDIVDRLSAIAPDTTEALWGTDTPTVRCDRIGDGAEAVMTWARHDQIRPSFPVDALDELSVAPSASLPDHLASVGELAANLATAVGLPDDLIEAVAAAGRFHDLGKADRRFQRWLGNHDPASPVAKSSIPIERWQAAQRAAGWPTGGRHELLSTQLLDAAVAAGVTIPAPDLVRHLVLSHHGHGRPLCGTTSEGAALTTRVTVDGIEIEAVTDTRCADWGQPDRFAALCERFGLWGLALLEAIVRQADHVVSAATEVQ